MVRCVQSASANCRKRNSGPAIGNIRSPIRRAELTASSSKFTRVNDQAIRRVLEVGAGPGGRLRSQQQKES